MKKKKFIVAIFIAIVILFIVITFCINNSKETVYSIDNIEPDVFYVGEKKYTLKKRGNTRNRCMESSYKN